MNKENKVNEETKIYGILKRSKNKKGLVAKVAGAFVILVVIVVVFFTFLSNREKMYKEAITYYDDFNYKEAYDLFYRLGNYKDAKVKKQELYFEIMDRKLEHYYFSGKLEEGRKYINDSDLHESEKKYYLSELEEKISLYEDEYEEKSDRFNEVAENTINLFETVMNREDGIRENIFYSFDEQDGDQATEHESRIADTWCINWMIELDDAYDILQGEWQVYSDCNQKMSMVVSGDTITNTLLGDYWYLDDDEINADGNIVKNADGTYSYTEKIRKHIDGSIVVNRWNRRLADSYDDKNVEMYNIKDNYYLIIFGYGEQCVAKKIR